MENVGNITSNTLVILTIVVPLLTVICGWLWRQIRANMQACNANERGMALMQQTLNAHQDKVGGIEDKVEALSNEVIQVKFSIQSLEHKNDKHHLELLNRMDAISHSISSN